MSLGSARETEYWLELLSELYPQFESEIAKIVSFNEETIKMLVSTINSLANRGLGKK
jgi:four helix bundle protein